MNETIRRQEVEATEFDDELSDEGSRPVCWHCD